MNHERIKQIALKKWYKLWNVKPWQFLEIHEKVEEWKNERIWKFRGLVIKTKKPNSHTGSFTIRGKVVGTVVEKVYPFICSSIVDIKIMDEYKIRRSKLYYIRNKVGKAAKFTSILDSNRRGDSLGFNELKLANQPKIEETKEEKKVVETPKVEVKEETTEEKSE